MSHHLEIDFGMMSGPRLRLVCTATPGSPCRMRPVDDRESWSYSDPDLIAGECWAVEWVEAGGTETMTSADGVTWPTIPVTVVYDEGVVLTPVAPHPLLWGDGATGVNQPSSRPAVTDPLPGLPEARDLLNRLRELGWTVIRTAGGR